ncbi:MAG TPA: galactose-1-phosphate uridylyltransferase, partial [Candidatus Ozemobacteraceae bacterium]|nr:galactose-1-phosphate uridylyltransferase [Candidatus Ozemobacteraceae bacterium]
MRERTEERMSELRFNTVTGDWVIIASERAKRPADFKPKTERPPLPEHSPNCPFCPGNEKMSADETLRYNDSRGNWLVRSVVNKFAALAPVEGFACDASGIHRRCTGYGRHEVIIESPQHHLTTALQPQSQINLILRAYRERFRAFFADEHIEHVIAYKNHGPSAGTSLEHPHSQIVGLPVVPAQVKGRLSNSHQHLERQGDCLFCQTLVAEEREGNRLVAQNDSFTAFIPYAALSPFHLWVFPRTHQACFGNISDRTLEDLGRIMKDVLTRLYKGLSNPDFNYVIRSAGLRDLKGDGFHWYISIVPRLNLAAGFELGTGMYVNPSIPETSA